MRRKIVEMIRRRARREPLHPSAIGYIWSKVSKRVRAFFGRESFGRPR